MEIHYIILRDGIILSKEKYKDWKEIQDKYPDSYMASLGPWEKVDLIDYFSDDFGDESIWPFSIAEIDSFFSSGQLDIVKLR